MDGAVADGLLHLAVEAVVEVGLREHGGGVLRLRQFDELPRARVVAVPERHEHGQRDLRAAHVVGGEDGHGGARARVAAQQLVPHHPLQVRPQRARVRVVPRQPVARGAHEDDVPALLAQPLPRDAQLLHGPHGAVLDHHVRARDHAPEDGQPLRAAQVDREAALVAVHAHEQRAVVPRARAGLVVGVGHGRGVGAHFLRRGARPRAARERLPHVLVLGLQHLRAEVGQQHRREGAGPHAREVDHAHAVEGQGNAHGPQPTPTEDGALSAGGTGRAARRRRRAPPRAPRAPGSGGRRPPAPPRRA